MDTMNALREYVRDSSQPTLRWDPRTYRLDEPRVVAWLSERERISVSDAHDRIAEALAEHGIAVTRTRFDRSDEIRGTRGSAPPAIRFEWFVPRGLLD